MRITAEIAVHQTLTFEAPDGVPDETLRALVEKHAALTWPGQTCSLRTIERGPRAPEPSEGEDGYA